MKHFYKDPLGGVTFVGNNESEALETMQQDYGFDLEEVFDLAIDGQIIEAKSRSDAEAHFSAKKRKGEA